MTCHLAAGPTAPCAFSLRSRFRSRARPSAALARVPHAAAWAALLAGGAALAQDGNTPSSDGATLPPVSVKADRGAPLVLSKPTASGSRLGLTPLETPASIEVLEGEKIRERGDLSVVDAVSRMTGITASPSPGNGGTSLNARGFNGHGSVSQLFDGTRLYVGSGTVTFPFSTWSVDRIETLRGAASVLYGEGSIGAAVNVIPKKPTRGAIENEALVGVGSHGHRQVAFGSGGAIDDRWSYRADISHIRSNGWVDRGDEESLAIGGALRFDLSPQLYTTLSYDEGHQQPQRYLGTPLRNRQFDESIREKNYNVEDAIIKYRDRATRLEMVWTPNDAVRVRNQFYVLNTKRHWKNAEEYLFTPTGQVQQTADGFVEIQHDQEQIGNRFDVSHSHKLGRMDNKVLVGVEANRVTFQRMHDFQSTLTPAPIDAYNPSPGSYQVNTDYGPRERSRTHTYAGFVEDRLSLTPQWSVVAGLRWDHIKVDRKVLLSGANFQRTYVYTTGRLGTVYELTPTQSVYGQWAQAVDPFTTGLINISPANAQRDMTTGEQVEVGYKQQLAEGRGEWSVAAYRIVKKKLQSRLGIGSGSPVQVGEQSSQGIEVTLDLALTNTLRLEANATKLRARYEDFEVGGASYTGNTPSNVPESAANAFINWQFLPSWNTALGARYVGRRQANPANTAQVSSYTVADASLAWRVQPGLKLQLQVRNLFDRNYPYAADTTQWQLGAPRTVQLSAHARF